MACNTIIDGTGTGSQAEVNRQHQLEVHSVSESLGHYANHEKGKSYSILISATPTGADDCFFYLKNTGTDDIVVEGITLYVASNEIVKIKLKDSGTPSGGSSITPVNLNTSSNNVLTATIKSGNNITGLSGGRVAYRLRRAADAEHKLFNFEQDIIVTSQQVLTLYAVTGGIAIECSLDVYSIAKEDL